MTEDYKLDRISSLPIRKQSKYIPSEYISELKTCNMNARCFDMDGLLCDYFNKNRYRLFGLYGISTRNKELQISKNWYTTTCYLSGKINIMLFAMLCVFYNNIGDEYDLGDKTEFIEQWTMIEYLLWELLTTNSLEFRSEPPSFEFMGQTTSQTLSDMLDSNAKELMRPITSVSKAESIYAVSLVPSTIHSPYSQVISLLKNAYDKLPCKCIDMTIALAGIKSPSGGIIHWFCFELYKDELYITSSWADGDACIQSTMHREKIDEITFNEMVNNLNNIEDDNLPDVLERYFFSNPIDARGNVIDPKEYILRTFDTSQYRFNGSFEIVIYHNYLDNVIQLTQYLYDESIRNESFQHRIRSNIELYKSGLYLPIGMEPFKILIGKLFNKIKSSCNKQDDSIIQKRGSSTRRRISVVKTRRNVKYKKRKSLKNPSNTYGGRKHYKKIKSKKIRR